MRFHIGYKVYIEITKERHVCFHSSYVLYSNYEQNNADLINYTVQSDNLIIEIREVSVD